MNMEKQDIHRGKASASWSQMTGITGKELKNGKTLRLIAITTFKVCGAGC